jgi:hypothetical protein
MDELDKFVKRGMTAQATVDRDIWLALFESEKRRHIEAGFSEEKADELAATEVRRQIRRS